MFLHSKFRKGISYLMDKQNSKPKLILYMQNLACISVTSSNSYVKQRHIVHEGYNAVSLYTIYYTSIIGNCTNVLYNHVYRYCIGCILYNVDTDYRCHICMR